LFYSFACYYYCPHFLSLLFLPTVLVSHLPLCLLFLLVFRCAATIEVNTNRPEANGEALVFSLKDIPGVKSGTMYYGSYIMVPLDIRFVLDDVTLEHYKARVFGDNQILVSVPSHQYSVLYNRDEIMLSAPSHVTNAMDNARHSFEEHKETRRWKHLLLEFAHGQVLSGKEIYSEAGDDEDLELELIPVHYTHSKATGDNSIHYAAWQVARTDVQVSKRGKVERKETKSKAAALLEGIMAGQSSMKTEQGK
jgi:hypothetical protein